jgi:hypothetical protein
MREAIESIKKFGSSRIDDRLCPAIAASPTPSKTAAKTATMERAKNFRWPGLASNRLAAEEHPPNYRSAAHIHLDPNTPEARHWLRPNLESLRVTKSPVDCQAQICEAPKMSLPVAPHCSN